MSDELLELKILRTGRVYSRLTAEKLRQWVAERRVLSDDLVRPVGGQRWMRVAVAPELAPGGACSGTPPVPGEVLGANDDETLGILVPAKLRPRRRWLILGDTEMDMTPMIDVTFQLLIFFMLTNSLANSAPVEVPEAKYGKGILPDGKQSILVDDQGQYYLGEHAEPENISPSLETLLRDVAENASKQEAPLEVIICAHKRSRYRQLRELVERLGTVPRIGPIHVGVEELQ